MVCYVDGLQTKTSVDSIEPMYVGICKNTRGLGFRVHLLKVYTVWKPTADGGNLAPLHTTYPRKYRVLGHAKQCKIQFFH